METPAFYSEYELDKFHISPLLSGLIPEAEKSIRNAEETTALFKKYQGR